MSILWSRLHCTVGDVLIILCAYWVVAYFDSNRRWIMTGYPGHVLLFTMLGLGYTVLSKWVNVDIRSA